MSQPNVIDYTTSVETDFETAAKAAYCTIGPVQHDYALNYTAAAAG